MATLYRKYRPQTFEEAVGQNHVKVTLENEIGSGKFSHAYLFCGPRAVGKTTMARLFAKSINCENKEKKGYEPCNNCSSCGEIAAGKSLDVVEIDAASHTGVDNVRENIIASSRISPGKLKYKVFIIDEVHMLSISAFNALLKVLEEPPANVVFILCTTEVHKVPATIISRCERFDFKKINIPDIVKKLTYVVNQEDIKVDKEILEAIAAHSEGYMRDAESLLGQLVSISGKEITQKEADLVLPRSDMGEIVELLDKISKKNISNSIRIINELVEEGADLKKFTSDLIEVLRKLMLNKIEPGIGEKLGFELGEKMEMDLAEINKRFTVKNLVDMINVFSEARNRLKNSFITQMPLELAVTKLYTQENKEQPEQSETSTPTPQNNSPAGRQEPPAPQTSPKTTFTNEPSIKENPQTPKSFGESATAPLPNEINRDTIVARWNEVLTRIKKHNHSLSFILKMCRPVEVKNNEVCLLFKYKFHLDRINDNKIRGLVENTLKEVFGSSLKVRAELNENLVLDENSSSAVANSQNHNQNSEKAGEQNNDMVNDILQTFEGKVVK
jgi:DNA polymerase-3 subunit gamma/tau